MNIKKIAIGIALIIVIAGGSFYGGTIYAKNSAGRGGFSGQAGQFGRAGRQGGFTGGQIISKDATSLTVKAPDGSTRYVLFATSTQVMKMTSGSLDDLSIGTTIAIMGSPNSDGSITATTIQIRPPHDATSGAGPGQ